MLKRSQLGFKIGVNGTGSKIGGKKRQNLTSFGGKID
jgi:hypothetical protein